MAVRAADASTHAPAKRPAPWMSIPGGPPEPDHAAFRARTSKLVEERRALMDEVKQLRASLGPREGREESDRERDELRQRLGEIDAQRKAEQDMRFRKNEEIQSVQRAHEERAAKLRELSDELGGFKSLKEIDDAIEYVTRRMETSGGGLAAEKRAVRRLARLEEAKKYLLELQPLTESIAEGKHREALLQREWREINERVRQLNGEYNEQRAARQQQQQEARGTGAGRQEIYKKCEAISAKITALSQTINAAYEEHNKCVEAWNQWRDEARALHAAKKKAEWEERQRRYLERQEAAKTEEKRLRALEAQSRYDAEIAACAVLTQYLRDQRVMVLREEAEQQRRALAAGFDPASHLPPGAVMINDGKKWADARGPTAGGKQQKQQKQKAAAKKAAEEKEKEKDKEKEKKEKKEKKDRVLHHSEDKVRLFQLINEEPPLSLDGIDAAVARIQEKMKEFSTHIAIGDLELSSEHEDAEEAKEEEEQTKGEEADGAEAAEV